MNVYAAFIALELMAKGIGAHQLEEVHQYILDNADRLTESDSRMAEMIERIKSVKAEIGNKRINDFVPPLLLDDTLLTDESPEIDIAINRFNRLFADYRGLLTAQVVDNA